MYEPSYFAANNGRTAVTGYWTKIFVLKERERGRGACFNETVQRRIEDESLQVSSLSERARSSCQLSLPPETRCDVLKRLKTSIVDMKHENLAALKNFAVFRDFLTFIIGPSNFLTFKIF